MKLRHTIAGTLALPLALAVASANAATVFDDERGKLQVGGYISGIAAWDIEDDSGQDSDVNFGIGLGLSRLNFTYTNDSGVTLFYENDWAGGAGGLAASGNRDQNGGTGYRLRHAAVSYNGLVAGQTWSGFANLTGLGETIDAVGTSGTATWANRTAVVGYNAPVADGMTVGIYLEDQSVGSDRSIAGKKGNNTAVPDITANFKGNFGDIDVFAGVRMVQVNDSIVVGKEDTEAKVDFAVGVNAQLSDEFNLKAGLTMYDEDVYKSAKGRDLAASLAAGFKVSEQVRTNAVVEFISTDDKDSDSITLWVNGFYTLDSGLELGGELQYVSSDDFAKRTDKDMTVRLQAKYAF